jgi:hypothetical protein
MKSPAWLEREISNGLQALLTLGLRRAPSADVIGMTLDIWLVPITKRLGGADEERGIKRVRGAFAQLFERRDWPTPADFLEALPDPVPLPALPAPKLSAEERARNIARLQAFMENLSKAKTMR